MRRMQRLMLVGFEGQPSADLIEGTARLWVERLSNYAPNRLAAAFDVIEQRKSLRRDGGGWPSPGDIIAAIPTYLAPEREPVPAARQVAPDPEADARIREQARKAIAECAAGLKVAL